MFRKLFAALVLLAAGFVGGMLLTARLHISNDSLADEVRATAAAPRPVPTATSAPTPGPVTQGLAGAVP